MAGDTAGRAAGHRSGGVVRREVLERLPVGAVVPELLAGLDAHGAAVLCAPPGTGKTTLVPLVLAGLVGGFGRAGGASGTEGPSGTAGASGVSGADSVSGGSGGEGGGVPRRVVVAEPRRLAAGAAARRMAWLLGEQVGGRVGYTVRGERVVGPGTRVEVVTTGVLLQRLLGVHPRGEQWGRDQELSGTDVVVLDECHERHLDADTVAAFLLDVRAVLRPGLRLVAASATTDAQGWARLLGGAPVVAAQGVSYPVDVVWAPPAARVRPPHGMAVDPALTAHVASVVRRALTERDGDVLCFLPGAGEIARVAGLLGALPGTEVLQVHGRAPAAVQDAVLTAGTRRRVVLATSVAESSLTVPGVRAVVDSGLARQPRTDHARGLSGLTTVRVSRAAAEQRAGRAGREAPGVVYRCWSEAEHGQLVRFPEPEIRVADLTAFALQTACWGDPDATGLALLDAPPPGALAAARSVLTAIGAVDERGRETAHGARLAGIGLPPRLARALLDGAREVGVRRAAEVVALLSEEPPRAYGDDLAGAWRTARRGSAGPERAAPGRGGGAASGGGGRAASGGEGGAGGGGGGRPGSGGGGDGYPARWRREVRRLTAAAEAALRAEGAAGRGDAPDAGGAGVAGADVAGADVPLAGVPGAGSAAVPGTGAGRVAGNDRTAGDDQVAGLVAALAYPERLARVQQGRSYLMVSGTRAELADGSALGGAPWLAVAVADRPVGRAQARVLLAAPVGEDLARRTAAPLLTVGEAVAWDTRDPRSPGEPKDVLARRTECLGAVELTGRPLASPSPALVRAALLTGLEQEGLGLLHWTRGAQELRARLAFLHARTQVHGSPVGDWPDVGDAALLARAAEWLEPELGRVRNRAGLGRVDAGACLQRLLPWASGEAARLDELAPERLTVPSGSRIRLDYTDPQQPVLAVKLQEMFGLDDTPVVAGVPVLVHLLSPAGRPAAVTSDLASFWRQGYPAVRAELRGRYPKHPWPEDPARAEPTRFTAARARR